MKNTSGTVVAEFLDCRRRIGCDGPASGMPTSPKEDSPASALAGRPDQEAEDGAEAPDTPNVRTIGFYSPYTQGGRRMYHGNNGIFTASVFVALMGGAALWSIPSLVGAEKESPPQVHHAGMAHPESSGWEEQLKGQTRVEDALEGRAGLSEKIEMQHQRIMRRLDEQVTKDAQGQATSGVFNNVSMMHQYMGQNGSSYLLAVDPDADLSYKAGAKCPAGVPTKHYDIFMWATCTC